MIVFSNISILKTQSFYKDLRFCVKEVPTRLKCFKLFINLLLIFSQPLLNQLTVVDHLPCKTPMPVIAADPDHSALDVIPLYGREQQYAGMTLCVDKRRHYNKTPLCIK